MLWCSKSGNFRFLFVSLFSRLFIPLVLPISQEENGFWNQDCDVVNIMVVEIAIYNADLFHCALIYIKVTILQNELVENMNPGRSSRATNYFWQCICSCITLNKLLVSRDSSASSIQNYVFYQMSKLSTIKQLNDKDISCGSGASANSHKESDWNW